jgi:hypothetical protein
MSEATAKRSANFSAKEESLLSLLKQYSTILENKTRMWKLIENQTSGLWNV